MNPRLRRTTTPIRCRNGICNFKIIGMGRVVIRISAKQFIPPAASVTVPSSMHFPLAGKVQYAEIGL